MTARKSKIEEVEEVVEAAPEIVEPETEPAPEPKVTEEEVARGVGGKFIIGPDGRRVRRED